MLQLGIFKKYQHEPSLPSLTAQAGKGRKNFSKNNPGANNERTSNQHDFETSSAGSDEGYSSDSEQAQNLNSIYPGKESVSQSSVVDSKSRAKAEKVVHGVPISLYIASHKNSLGLSAVVEDTSPAMRVFVQCYEVKSKGLRQAGEKECQRLEGPKDENLLMKSLARSR